MLTKKEIKIIIDGILSGLFTVEQLPRTLFLDIFEQLEKSLLRGLSVKDKKKLSKAALSSFLKISGNLRRFSAAKTYQVIKNVGMLNDIEEMTEKFNLYMKTWQRVENDLALKQGQTVNSWFTYDDQKDILPYLKYVTAQDERVRHSHALLNGIIKPVDDSFWNEYIPANGYQCRCTVEQLEKAASTKVTPNDKKLFKQEISPQFRNNPAKTGFIFKETGKDKHPYFVIPEKDKKAIEKLI